MDTEILAELLDRELRTLRREVEAYPDDESLWANPDGVSNAGGALARHVVGNLRHFIGHRLGGSAFVRNRVDELSQGTATRSEIALEVEACREEVARALGNLDPAMPAQAFPDPIAGHRLGTLEFICHLLSHTGYHLGQLDYHRRMVTGVNTLVDAMAIPEIPGARPVA